MFIGIIMKVYGFLAGFLLAVAITAGAERSASERPAAEAQLKTLLSEVPDLLAANPAYDPRLLSFDLNAFFKSSLLLGYIEGPRRILEEIAPAAELDVSGPRQILLEILAERDFAAHEQLIAKHWEVLLDEYRELYVVKRERFTVSTAVNLLVLGGMVDREAEARELIADTGAVTFNEWIALLEVMSGYYRGGHLEKARERAAEFRRGIATFGSISGRSADTIYGFFPTLFALGELELAQALRDITSHVAVEASMDRLFAEVEAERGNTARALELAASSPAPMQRRHALVAMMKRFPEMADALAPLIEKALPEHQPGDRLLSWNVYVDAAMAVGRQDLAKRAVELAREDYKHVSNTQVQIWQNLHQLYMRVGEEEKAAAVFAELEAWYKGAEDKLTGFPRPGMEMLRLLSRENRWDDHWDLLVTVFPPQEQFRELTNRNTLISLIVRTSPETRQAVVERLEALLADPQVGDRYSRPQGWRKLALAHMLQDDFGTALQVLREHSVSGIYVKSLFAAAFRSRGWDNLAESFAALPDMASHERLWAIIGAAELYTINWKVR